MSQGSDHDRHEEELSQEQLQAALDSLQATGAAVRKRASDVEQLLVRRKTPPPFPSVR